MTRPVYALTCLYPLQDRATNLFSFINAVEQVTAPSLPVDLSDLYVATNWIRDIGDPEAAVGGLRVQVRDPHDTEIALSPEVDPIPFSGVERARVNIHVPVFEAKEEGLYSLAVQYRLTPEAEWNDEIVLPFRVVERSAESEV